jgi:hypothetical protein
VVTYSLHTAVASRILPPVDLRCAGLDKSITSTTGLAGLHSSAPAVHKEHPSIQEILHISTHKTPACSCMSNTSLLCIQDTEIKTHRVCIVWHTILSESAACNHVAIWHVPSSSTCGAKSGQDFRSIECCWTVLGVAYIVNC